MIMKIKYPDNDLHHHNQNTWTVMGVGNMMGKVLQCQSEARARSRRGRMAGIISDGMLAWRSDVIMMIILMTVMTTMTMTQNKYVLIE